MSVSRFDYEAMRAIARRIEQYSADLQAYLDQVQGVAQSLEERCRSPFVEMLKARSAEWVQAGQQLVQSLQALGVDLARIVEAQIAAEEQEAARFAQIPY